MLGASCSGPCGSSSTSGFTTQGWTRQQAIDYLGGPTPKTSARSTVTWSGPGQALAYKIASSSSSACGAKAGGNARRALTSAPSTTELLRDGAMPLSVLESKMDRWIAGQTRR